MTLRTWHKSIGSLTRPVTRLLKTGLYTPTAGVDWQSPSTDALATNHCFAAIPPNNCMSKQFVNDVVSIAILATCWHEVPLPPLEGEVPNEREAEGFVR